MRKRNPNPIRTIATAQAAAAGMDNPTARIQTIMTMTGIAIMPAGSMTMTMVMISAMTMTMATNTRMLHTITILPWMRTPALP